MDDSGKTVVFSCFGYAGNRYYSLSFLEGL